MHFLVSQCYTWEGYHLVQALLEDGHEVSGLHEEALSEREMHLSMYLARHAMFSEGIRETEYRASISFFGSMEETDAAHHHVDISYEAADVKERKNQILLPILYGEWMHRNESAAKWNGQSISFQSDYFRRQALPITSVMQTISKLLSRNADIGKYRFYTKDVCPEQEDRTIIAFTRNITDDLTVLHRHYSQFTRFYK